VPESAKKNGLPEPLVWHIALENMPDQERFKSLNWGLLTWDHWLVLEQFRLSFW